MDASAWIALVSAIIAAPAAILAAKQLKSARSAAREAAADRDQAHQALETARRHAEAARSSAHAANAHAATAERHAAIEAERLELERRRSTARLQVECTTVFVFDHPAARAGLAEDTWEFLESQGIAQKPGMYIAIEGSNIGEIATTVTAFGFEYPGGQLVTWPENLPTSDKLPKRIEPGESARTTYRPEKLAAACQEYDIQVSDLTPYVLTGHGRMRGEVQPVAITTVEGMMSTNDATEPADHED